MIQPFVLMISQIYAIWGTAPNESITSVAINDNDLDIILVVRRELSIKFVEVLISIIS